MDIFGIGPLELILILVIMLIVLGPADMVKMGSTLGKYIRRFMMSPTWRALQETSRTIRTLPNRLAREAGVEEFEKTRRELEKEVGESRSKIDAGLGAWTETPLVESPPPPQPTRPDEETPEEDTQTPPTDTQES